MGRLTLGVAAIASLVAGCGGSSISGLSQAQAVSAAMGDAQEASTTPVTFVSAVSGWASGFEPDSAATHSDPNREVWAIVFRGTFHGSCGPANSPVRPCPAPNTTMRVVIDYVSGQFIMSEIPAETS